MRNTSALYKQLRNAENSYYEVRVTRGNNTYGLEDLKSAKIFPALFEGSGPQIGQTCSAECDISVKELSQNWPRMAEFTVELRISSEDGTQKSEWLSMGTFYTDQRSKTEGGALSIIAFDKMLFLEQTWADKIPEALIPTSWPITSDKMAEILEAVTGIDLDPRTVLDNTLACWGLDTNSTAKERWGDIAAAHGGNFIITPEGKLRLVPLVNGITEETAIAGIAIAGIAVVGTNGMEALEADVVQLGVKCQKLKTSPALQPITGVSLETIDGDKAAVGNDSGYTLTGSCNFSNTGVASLCLSKLQGVEYRPFEAEKALLDPAAEPGDLIAYYGGMGQAMSIQWTLGKHPRADISAPYDEEINHEYAVQSSSLKAYRRAVSSTDEKLKFYPTIYEMNTAIEQTAGTIRIEASQSYVKIDDYDAAIADLQNQIDGSITQFSGPDVPTLYNYPAVDWNTDSKKSQHVGSLYLVTSDGGSEQAGQYYRFEQNGNQFGWVLVEDSALAKALADAAAAQAAADQAQADADAAQAAADAAQGTADQARLEAIAEAAQAQAVAITQAAVDATNKANEALEAAKAYADAQFREFINGEYLATLEALKEQLDQKAETFYQADDPHTSWSNTIAGIAIAGVSVVGATWADHKGDLWYRTTDGTTWYWTGTGWLQQNVPTAVFDQIDGRAQIFITNSNVLPSPPYNAGDIWVNATYSSETVSYSNDLLRCSTPKDTGETPDISDWIRADKYTDDTKAEAVETDLHTNYFDKVETQAAIDVTATEIRASVLSKRGGEQQSFGWVLTDSAHVWYSNNQEVMRIDSNGLSVNGSGTFSGTIYASDGTFSGTISASTISGSTISGSTISGGTISIGNGSFYVNERGELSASSGTFGGNVYANNIQYASHDGVGGSLSGAAITGGTISTTELSSGVNGSLSSADLFGAAIVSGTSTYPSYFKTGSLSVVRSVSAGEFYIDFGDGSSSAVSSHTHNITLNNGVIAVGAPSWNGSPSTINISSLKPVFGA